MSTNRWMDKGDVVHIYNGILLLSHKKEWNNAIFNNMNGPRDYHTDQNESERKIQIPYDVTYAAAAAKSLQSCPTLCNPTDGSPPGSLSLGFSRQEHWSGLPFPSPMHESEKWKWSRSVVSDSLRPHGLQPTRLLHPWEFPGKSTGVGCHCLLQFTILIFANLLDRKWYIIVVLICSFVITI